MYIKIPLIVLILCFGTVGWADDIGEKFCDDPKAWEHFNSMVEEYPTDIAIQILHALKIGLCAKIQNNSISPSCRFRRTNPIKISGLITRQAIHYKKAGRAFTLPALIM